ncbi:MAG: hypothetical protein ACLPN5_19495 [Roseiarcus sp.]
MFETVPVAPPCLDPQTYSAENRHRLSRPALRIFFAIVDLWKLTEEERRRDR